MVGALSQRAVFHQFDQRLVTSAATGDGSAAGESARSFDHNSRQVFEQIIDFAIVVINPQAEADAAARAHGFTPIAVRTWEGSSEPVVQAEPLEAQMPS